MAASDRTFEETVRGCEHMALWPADRMPYGGASEPEHLHEPGRDTVMRVTSVSSPEVYFFPAAGSSSTCPAPVMVVCPGGGYGILAWDLEGTEIAARLNASGMSAVVLKYRCPDNRAGAYADVQRAIRLVRSQASAWGIDPARVGVMGFSAGGHLSARAATGANRPAYEALDEVDAFSPVPNFAVLVYPAYLNDESEESRKDSISPEFLPLAELPPVLLLHNEDDPRFVRGSQAFLAELRRQGRDVEGVFYADGGHGYGLRSAKSVRVWADDMVAWFRRKGFLG